MLERLQTHLYKHEAAGFFTELVSGNTKLGFQKDEEKEKDI